MERREFLELIGLSSLAIATGALQPEFTFVEALQDLAKSDRGFIHISAGQVHFEQHQDWLDFESDIYGTTRMPGLKSWSAELRGLAQESYDALLKSFLRQERALISVQEEGWRLDGEIYVTELTSEFSSVEQHVVKGIGVGAPPWEGKV